MTGAVYQTAFRVLLVLALVLVNAFFVAAEFSIVTIRHTRVEQLIAERHPLARALQRAVLNPTPYIATTQLGVTIASLALGWVGEPALAAAMLPVLEFLPNQIARIGANSIAVVLAFIVMTSVTIVVGELIPKNLALQRPEAVAFVVIEPLRLLRTIFGPFVSFLTTMGVLGLRVVGLSAAPSQGLVYSVDELKMIVAASRQAGVLEENEEDMIERVFNFDEVHAHEVMVPRTEMVSVPVSATIGYVNPYFSRKRCARRALSSTSTPTIRNPREAYRFDSTSIHGASSLHGGHHVAKKLR